MQVGFLIKVRLKSTRLKSKAILKLNSEPMIVHMIRRIKKYSDLFSNIIICTSTNTQDDPLEDIARQENINIFRGSEDDVLKRYYEATQAYNLDFFLKAGADNPLVSLDYASQVLNYAKENSPGLITMSKLPIGLFFYGICPKALKKVIDRKKTDDTEVWGNLFKNHNDITLYDFPVDKKYMRTNYRLTVDYSEDFVVIKNIFNHFSDKIYDKSTLEILDFLDKNTSVLKINQSKQKLYEKNIGNAI